MKAIQIKYLTVTNTQPSRLKAWVSSTNHLAECRNDMEIEEQALSLANKLIQKLNWVNCEVSAIGCLPNGDYVAILKHKE